MDGHNMMLDVWWLMDLGRFPSSTNPFPRISRQFLDIFIVYFVSDFFGVQPTSERANCTHR